MGEGSEPLLVGIDSSTQSSKAIVWTSEGTVVAQGQRPIEVHQPGSNWIEHDCPDWWSSTRDALNDAVSQVDPRRLQALGITHQRETFVPLNDQRRPLRRALLWSDARAARQVREIKQSLGEKYVRNITGKTPDLTPSLYKILWLRENEPEVFEQASVFADVHAYLAWKLTGRMVASFGSADPTSLFDIQSMEWSEPLLSEVGLTEDQLPDLAPPGTVLGEIHGEAAEETGLPEGLPVVSGLGDGQCASLGCGVVEAGSASLNLGSASVLGAFSPDYQVDPAFRTMIGPDAGYVLESVIRSGAYTITWFVNNFPPGSVGEGLEISPEEILELAANKVPPGSEGLISVPYWNAAMMPYWDPEARGITLGWSTDHTRAHFYRSILEGVAFEHRIHKEEMEKAIGTGLEQVVVLGGGANSSLWCQMIADILQSPIYRTQTTEATCLGAAILAAKGVDLYGSASEAASRMVHKKPCFSPRSEERKKYDRLYDEVYLNLFPQVREALQTLHNLTHGD